VLHVEVLGRHLSKDTTPALSILDGLPKRTTLKKKAALIDTLTVCAGNSDPSMLALADKGGNFSMLEGLLLPRWSTLPFGMSTVQC